MKAFLSSTYNDLIAHCKAAQGKSIIALQGEI